MADAILAGASGSYDKCYIGLDGFTATYGTLIVTVASSNTDRITVSEVTNEGAATINGELYASGDCYSWIATAANGDVNVDVPMRVTVQGTDYKEDICYTIRRQSCQ